LNQGTNKFMSNLMTQNDFEAMCRGLFNIIDNVKDEKKLAEVACAFFTAQAAALIKRSNVNYEIKDQLVDIIYIYPYEFKKIVNKKPADLWSWYAKSEMQTKNDGFTKNAIEIAGNIYKESLVAFGTYFKDENFRYELILLKTYTDSDNMFCAYHTWAASWLIKNFEKFQFFKKIKELKDFYSKNVSKTSLRSIQWDDLFKSFPKNDDEIIPFWNNVAIKLGYDYQEMFKSNKIDLYNELDPHKEIDKKLDDSKDMDIIKYFSKYLKEKGGVKNNA